MSKIKYKDLKKTGNELRECLRDIPQDTDGKIEFFKLLEIIKDFCDAALNEDQAALFSRAIASTLYPAMKKRGGFLSEIELKKELIKYAEIRKNRYCWLEILNGFLTSVILFEEDQEVLIGGKKIDELLIAMAPIPTTPFNDKDPYS